MTLTNDKITWKKAEPLVPVRKEEWKPRRGSIGEGSVDPPDLECMHVCMYFAIYVAVVATMLLWELLSTFMKCYVHKEETTNGQRA